MKMVQTLTANNIQIFMQVTENNALGHRFLSLCSVFFFRQFFRPDVFLVMFCLHR